MKYFRPRFTLRTLVIFVTLVCAYFAAWEATKRWGVPKRESRFSDGEAVSRIVAANSPAPFIVVSDEYYDGRMPPEYPRRYYFWLLGSRIRIAERSWKHITWRTD